MATSTGTLFLGSSGFIMDSGAYVTDELDIISSSTDAVIMATGATTYTLNGLIDAGPTRLGLSGNTAITMAGTAQTVVIGETGIAWGATGISMEGVNSTVLNDGMIRGSVLMEADGSSITNTGVMVSSIGIYSDTGASGIVIENSGLIRGSEEGFATIWLGGGASATITNTGTISFLTDASGFGMMLDGSTFDVTNDGLISGFIALQVTSTATSYLDNGVDGQIVGALGVIFEIAASEVINEGLIEGTNGFGLQMRGGGTVHNTGTIIGNSGVEMQAAGGTIINEGLIEGRTRDGLTMSDGGTLDNSGTIVGASGFEAVLSSAQIDVINTGTITGTVSLGDGADLFDSSGGTVSGLVRGGNGNDTLIGDRLNDRLLGEGDDDTLVGGRGADVLEGGAGNDTLNGNRGNDTLEGGSGMDTFVIDTDTGVDTIVDWNSADDTIDMTAFGIRKIELTDIWTRDGSTVTFDLDLIGGTGDLVILNGANNLFASDFLV